MPNDLSLIKQTVHLPCLNALHGVNDALERIEKLLDSEFLLDTDTNIEQAHNIAAGWAQRTKDVIARLEENNG